MTVEQRGLLIRAMAEQSHYPCRCHDWVWYEDHWELVKREQA